MVVRRQEQPATADSAAETGPQVVAVRVVGRATVLGGDDEPAPRLGRRGVRDREGARDEDEKASGRPRAGASALRFPLRGVHVPVSRLVGAGEVLG